MSDIDIHLADVGAMLGNKIASGTQTKGGDGSSEKNTSSSRTPENFQVEQSRDDTYNQYLFDQDSIVDYVNLAFFSANDFAKTQSLTNYDSKKYFKGPEFVSRLSSADFKDKLRSVAPHTGPRAKKRVILNRVSNPDILGVYGGYQPEAVDFEKKLSYVAELSIECSVAIESKSGQGEDQSITSKSSIRSIEITTSNDLKAHSGSLEQADSIQEPGSPKTNLLKDDAVASNKASSEEEIKTETQPISPPVTKAIPSKDTVSKEVSKSILNRDSMVVSDSQDHQDTSDQEIEEMDVEPNDKSSRTSESEEQSSTASASDEHPSTVASSNDCTDTAAVSNENNESDVESSENYESAASPNEHNNDVSNTLESPASDNNADQEVITETGINKKEAVNDSPKPSPEDDLIDTKNQIKSPTLDSQRFKTDQKLDLMTPPVESEYINARQMSGTPNRNSQTLSNRRSGVFTSVNKMVLRPFSTIRKSSSANIYDEEKAPKAFRENSKFALSETVTPSQSNSPQPKNSLFKKFSIVDYTKSLANKTIGKYRSARDIL
ncbi:hypothetical protein AYI68_g2489 [Smittium mucronatum]|uniref:Uncharacterized protein n=1 Tax=Smittium mucronatum TaxID=133383 RepID=A0A1R0H2I9_9FUNG|nr:hypothetical protein AYI68_g2489 [Smittium mucronatum]